MLDGIIALTVILFILSIVSEKFVQLIRSYPENFSIILIIVASFSILRGFCNIIKTFKGANLSHFYCLPTITLQVSSIICNLLFLISFFLFLSLKGQKIFFKDYKSYNSLFFLVLSFLFFVLSVCLTRYTWNIFLGGIFLFSSLVSLGVMSFDELNIGSKNFSLKFFERIKKDFVSSDNSEEKEKKENEITLLSIFIGFLVAFAFKANFFDLIKDFKKNDEKIIIGWNEGEFPFQYQIDTKLFNIEAWDFEVSFIIGIILTGFFLSFGSKFFHDLLDRLYYAKKANQALNDPELLNQDSANELRQFVENYNVEKTYHRYKSTLMLMPGITGVSIQKRLEGKNIIDFLMVSLEDKFSTILKTKIINTIGNEEIPIEFEANVNDFQLTSRVSFLDSIANLQSPDSKGSIALEVINEEDTNSRYILTCFHVVKHKSHSWNGNLSGNKTENRVVIGPKNSANGTIVKAFRSNFWESALIRLDSEVDLGSLKSLINVTIKGYKALNDANIIGENAYMFSREKSSNQKGEILSHASTIKVHFEGDTDPLQMYDLIKVRDKVKEQPIQELGDSGNLLYDHNGYALGIVFAKSTKFTYAMDLKFPLTHFNVKIKTP